MSTNLSQKNLESSLRAKLQRLGFGLLKSRYCHPELKAFYAGFMILNRDMNVVVEGAWPREFSLTLADVEQFVTD